MLSRELPRSAHSRHAATFDIKTMECMTSGSRKRRRYDLMPDQRLPKVPRISWERPNPVPQSSPPVPDRQRPTYHDKIPSFVTESDTIPDDSQSPLRQNHIDPELSKGGLPYSSSVAGPLSPRTPPPKRTRPSSHRNGEDGADLLLYLANSPTPANVGGKIHMPEFLPSTPPTQHAGLPSLISTPGQPFNFADFVNVTPSPAHRPWNSRTPLALPKTPRTTREVGKRLNFDNLQPPAASPQHKSPRTRTGLALQLGEELPI